MRKFLLLAIFGVSSAAFAQTPSARALGDDSLGAYQSAVKKVRGGEKVVVVLGSDDSLLRPGDRPYRYTKFTETPELKDQKPGVYDCYQTDDGRLMMQIRVPPPRMVAQDTAPTGGLQLGFQFTGPFGNTVAGGVCVGRT